MHLHPILEDDEEYVFMGDLRPSLRNGKRKVFLKMTSSKVLALNDGHSCATYSLEFSVDSFTWESKEYHLIKFYS